MTGITIAMIVVSVLILVTLLFIAARRTAPTATEVRVYHSPGTELVFLEISTTRFGISRVEYHLLTPDQAEIMADKLHLSAYAARNHLRSDTRQESTKIDDWTWIARGRGPA